MLIVANWKAYVEDLPRAKKLLSLSKKASLGDSVSIIIAPPAPFLGVLATGNRSKVAFAAQDISPTIGGAETGESTAGAYAGAGATYVLIGHSERRAMGDTSVIIAEKLARALAHNLTPILCVGESERDSDGKYLSIIREEITTALTSLTPKERTKIIIAYEPLWAIGKTAHDAATSKDVTEMALYVRKVLAELLPGKSSSRSIVLYGGSVEPLSIRDLANASHIDGFLVGRASADPIAFNTLLRELR